MSKTSASRCPARLPGAPTQTGRIRVKPARADAAVVHLTIDGHALEARAGQTILEAALEHGIEIPNLCFNRKVNHVASCRLCVVRIEGRPAAGIPSCTTPVEEGMKVTAFSPELEKIRRTVLDLALSNHNDDCISCVKDGACELQDLAFRYDLGRGKRRFPPVWAELGKTSDFSSPVLDYDASKCIQCKRCVRACSELQGKGVLSFVNRGIRTTVGTGYPQWKESTCDGCGECSQICPVGAITPKPLYGGERLRNKDITRTVRTTCPYCGVGCQLDVHLHRTYSETGVRESIVKVTGAEDAPNHGKLCVKGRFGLDYVERGDRLTTPLVRRDGTLVPATWDEALAEVAAGFKRIVSAHGPEAMAGLASARVTNEENYVFQRFMRQVIGSRHVDHCARLCHASTVAGLAITLGSGAMTNTVADLEQADLILITGTNTTEAHPVIATAIKKAVLQHGAKLIVIDPRRIDLVRYATLWLRQNHGSDIAWINGMIQHIIANGLENRAYIDQHTEGFAEMAKTAAGFDPATVESLTGIPRADLAEAARLYATAKRASICYSMGITQHAHGTDNVKSLSNLALLCGQIGRPGTGINPLRGQNNVQGACDMGALPNVLPGYQKVDDDKLRGKFEQAWGGPLPAKPGKTVVEIMHDAHQGGIKGLYIMGENPMLSDPDLTHVEAALRHLDFLVVQDIFLTETAQLAHVVLPACTSLEKDGTFTNTERRVLPVRKVIEPVGESRADWRIIQDLAKLLGHDWNYNCDIDILREINRLVPSYGGITHERLESGTALHWPCPDAQHPGTPILHTKGPVRGKGLFAAIPFTGAKEPTDAQYPLVLSTGRVLFHYHTCSMTRRTTALPKYCPDAYVEVNPADCVRLGLADGEKVAISSRRGRIEIPVKRTDRVVPGNLFIPFHFAEAAANVLTIDALDPTAKIPEFKVCAVQLEKLPA